MRNFYHRIFVIALAGLLFAMDASAQESILLVGRDGLGDYQSDQDMNDSLIAWGYLPDFWDSNGEFAPGVGLDYDAYDAILINESVDSKAMARFGTTDGYPLPCVNMEGYTVAPTSDRWAWLDDLSTDLLQTEDQGGTADDQVLVIKDNSHYITSDFQVGDEVVWSVLDIAADIPEVRPVSIKEVNVSYAGKLGQMKSHQSQADFWNLVTVDDIAGTGNRLVQWGLNHNGLNGFDQTGSFGTPEFYMLVKKSLEWVLGKDGGGTSVEDRELHNYNLVAFPNPASEQVTIRFRAPGQTEALATLYNMAGQRVDAFQKSTVQGNNFLYLQAGKYPAGIYQLHLDLGDGSAVTKVVIQ